ncbi:reverse transcriptase domain protein [Colletotrichum tofieldiae]|nr:reverse transcriptase domain protein [Colletotrichum tofieldiae]GKT77073.1 reverse transcriptase domain protein [Colletotrichum tofieldiae]
MDSSKSTQRLRSDADWVKWLNNLKMVANFHEVWQYIDPNQNAKNSEPQPEPLPAVGSADFSDTMRLIDFNYRNSMRKYEARKSGIIKVAEWVTSTVDQVYLGQVTGQPTVRDMVKALKAQLEPDSFARQQQVLQRYNAHRRSIKRTRLTEWLIIYQEIIKEAISAKVPQLIDPTTQVSEFLNAIKEIAPDYYTGASYDFSRQTKQEAKEGETCPGVKQAQSFRQWVRTFYPTWLTANDAAKSTTSSSFAT